MSPLNGPRIAHFRFRVLAAARTLITAGLIAGITTAVAQADWPQWRGPGRTGFIETQPLVQSLPQQGLAPRWKLDGLAGGNSGGWSSPVISGGRVFAYSHTKTKNPDASDAGPAKYPWLSPDKRTGMTDAEYEAYEVKRRDENEKRAKAFRFNERLVCLDLQSGELIWDRSVESKYTRFTHSGTPCVSGDRVFVLGAERTARCYDAKSGDILWSKRLPGEFRDEYFCSSFVVDDQVALVSCGPITALDVENGEVLWQGDEPLDYQSHSSPAIWPAAGGSVVIVNAKGATIGYRVSEGKRLWKIDSGAGQSTPIVADDWLLTYGSSRKSGLKAFRLAPQATEKEPTLAWQFQRAADSGSTPVVRGSDVFVQGEKRLAKLQLADGKAVWQTTLKISTPKYTSLIAAGDQVFFGWEGLLSFDATAERFQPLYDAEVDSDGMLIRGDDLRAKLKLDQLASDADGLAKSEQIWQKKAIQSGPLACCTPAISDGRIVIRLRNAIACYDLRRQPNAAGQ